MRLKFAFTPRVAASFDSAAGKRQTPNVDSVRRWAA